MSQKHYECDLLVIGGGPAGLSAALSGASEALHVVLLESRDSIGGQAKQSNLIENYFGFPEISGQDLMLQGIRQAEKFGVEIQCGKRAAALRMQKDRRVVMTEDGDVYTAKTVIIAMGLWYRRLHVPGINVFMHRGVRYVAPPTSVGGAKKRNVCVVGGANSAGQAAMGIAKDPNATVTILVRRTMADLMSHYLIERIEAAPNVEVIEGVNVTRLDGDSKLERVTITSNIDQTVRELPADEMYIYIGADPKTHWLKNVIPLDKNGYILTGTALLTDTTGKRIDGNWKEVGRMPFNHETGMPGVFAAGDVDSETGKRIAAAVGSGVEALQDCHRYLTLNGLNK